MIVYVVEFPHHALKPACLYILLCSLITPPPPSPSFLSSRNMWTLTTVDIHVHFYKNLGNKINVLFYFFFYHDNLSLMVEDYTFALRVLIAKVCYISSGFFTVHPQTWRWDNHFYKIIQAMWRSNHLFCRCKSKGSTVSSVVLTLSPLIPKNNFSYLFPTLFL